MKRKVLGRGLSALIPDDTSLDNSTSQTLSPNTSAPAPDFRNESIQNMDIDLIFPNSDQPRQHFDREGLEELSESIKKYGLLQPILVRPKEDQGFEIIAGERRYRAAKLAGLKEIAAIIRQEGSDKKVQMIALVENLQREDLNPIEEAMAYESLIRDFGLTQQEVADQVGKSRSAVANAVRLLSLDEESKRALKARSITSTQARTLLSQTDLVKRYRLLKSFVNQEITVNDAERKNRKLDRALERDPFKQHYESAFRDALGTKVSIRPGKKVSRIEIEYYSPEDLERLLEIIQGQR